jgi:acetate---CoA ligase (ADP-forming)
MNKEFEEKSDLFYFFNAMSIAIIGASNNPGKVGYDVVKNLKLANYPGKIYPVNPKESSVQGYKSYKSLLDINKQIELVIISVPSNHVLNIIDQMHESKIKSVIIITAGFKEIGPEGAKLENELSKKLKKYNIRAIGPNCLGLLSTGLPLNASFASRMPRKGNLGFISQSGALITGILDWAEEEELGFSTFISVGNKTNVDEVDLIEELGRDDNTKAILAYLESIDHGSDFIRVCREVAKTKPILVLKSGRSLAGARAASSHTGSMAGTDESYVSAFKKAGVIRAKTVEELFDTATAFSSMPLPNNNRLCIITNAGGPGIIATDDSEFAGLELSILEPDTINYLHDILPAAASTHNPVDILGTANGNDYYLTLEAVLKDNNVDMVLVILTPQGMTEPMKTAVSIVELHGKYKNKAISAIYMGGADLIESVKYLKSKGIPTFEFPERGVRALAGLWQYVNIKSTIFENYQVKKFDDVDRDFVEGLFESVRNKGRVALLGSEAISVARAYGINAPLTKTAFSINEAKYIAKEIGYPIVMKITSPDIVHKTDIGGVKIGIKSEDELAIFFKEMMQSAREHYPEAKVVGIDIQKLATTGHELIIGASKDPQFGHMAIIGAGGIYTNIYKDVSFGLIPISQREAMNMLENTKIYQILKGARGLRSVDTDKIIETLLRLSQLIEEFPQILDLDVNPFFVNEDGICAVDVKITIQSSKEVN